MKLKLTALSFVMAVTASSAFAEGQELPFVDVRPERITAAEAQMRQAGTPVPRQQPQLQFDQEALRRQAMALSDPSYGDLPLDEFGRPLSFEPIPQVGATEQLPKFLQEAIENYKPEQQVDMEPRQNRILPVGFGFMNSIQTNFKQLAVRTSDEFSILEIEDGFLYVTPLSDQPISLILYEDGVLESQVSIVLYPIDAPPAMIDLTVNMTPRMIARAREHQERIQKEVEAEEARRRQADADDRKTPPSAHVAYLTNLLKQVAQEQTPRGFNMTNDIPPQLAKPCRLTIEQLAGQRLTGNREVVDVVVIRNDSDRIYHVKEEMCISRDTLAVAIHDKAYLRPGDETEVYIIRDRFYQEERQRQITRPRLRLGE